MCTGMAAARKNVGKDPMISDFNSCFYNTLRYMICWGTLPNGIALYKTDPTIQDSGTLVPRDSCSTCNIHRYLDIIISLLWPGKIISL